MKPWSPKRPGLVCCGWWLGLAACRSGSSKEEGAECADRRSDPVANDWPPGLPRDEVPQLHDHCRLQSPERQNHDNQDEATACAQIVVSTAVTTTVPVIAHATSLIDGL